MSNASEVSICNQAIGWLGGNLITALSDNSLEASLCAANYASLRDTLLEMHEWTFAQSRFLPPLLSGAPAWGYSAQFQLPVSILRVVYCGRSARVQEDDPVENWTREGGSIMCNETAIYCRGIKQITDPTLFSNLFGQALAGRLAMDIALPLTNSHSMMDNMSKLFGAKISEAVRTDGKQGKSRLLSSPGMVQARRAGSTGSTIGPYV